MQLQIEPKHVTIANENIKESLIFQMEEKRGENTYLHEKVGEKALIDASGSQGRGQMLQAGGLQPARHDGIAGIGGGPCRTVQGSSAGVVIQSSGCSIALVHLATHVALRSPLGRQFSRSVYTRFAQTHALELESGNHHHHHNHNNNNRINDRGKKLQ